MTTKIITVLSMFLLIFTTSVAQVTMGNMSVQSQIQDPLAGFDIEYRLFGSKYGVGAAAAQMQFYLSQTKDGSGGVIKIRDTQISLRGNGLGPYSPQPGIQRERITRFTMGNNAVNQIENTCFSGTWYVLGRIDFTPLAYDQTSISVLPDFKFKSGTISPGTIYQGGTLNLKFAVETEKMNCKASQVGVFLADANQQAIGYIGGVSIGTGKGVFSTGDIPITFSPTLAAGLYHIILVADVNNEVPESNENNNRAGFTLTILNGAAPVASKVTKGSQNVVLTKSESTKDELAQLRKMKPLVSLTQMGSTLDNDSPSVTLSSIEENTNSEDDTIIEDIKTYSLGQLLEIEFSGNQWDNSLLRMYDQNGRYLGEINHSNKEKETFDLKTNSKFYIMILEKGKNKFSKKIYVH